MGRLLKKIARIKLPSSEEIDIELNYPTSGKGEDIIHVQHERFRLEFRRNEFIRLATEIISGADQLKRMKKIKKHE